MHDIIISDHLPVYIIKKKHRIKKEYTKVHGRPMKKYYKEHFQSLVQNDYHWHKFWSAESFNEKWKIMLLIITVSLNSSLPLKAMRIPNNSPPWLTSEILDMINLKNKLFKLAKLDKNHWNSYRDQKHLVNRTVKREKRNTVQKTLDDNKNNPKEFWMEIKNLLGTNSISSDAIKTIRNAGGTILNDKEAADYMNDYYAHIGENLANLIPDINWNAHNNFMNIESNGFRFRLITEKETRALVKGIDSTKSSAMDRLKSIFVKDAFECINFELCYLLNESLRLGEYPISWGYSYVTPIPKEGDRLDPNNWRPISQMPIIGRLIEKAIHTQLKYYLDCKGILHKNQHGFRARKSTGSAIFDYINNLFSAYDSDESTVSVYIDYKKAFDTISHQILLKKLKLYGLSKMCLSWFEQYLDHRTQCTIVNGHKSNTQPISYGVPQGSTLGPTLFILYVNDLFTYPGIENVSTLMYADDTVIYRSSDDPTDALENIQIAMNNTQNWCEMDKLTINGNKTKFTIFLRKPSDRKYQVVCNKNLLERTTTYKYLGADIDNTLTMDSFNKNVCKKVNFKLYMFGKIRKYITTHAAILIYKQTILPYFDYGRFLMNSASQNSISKLDKYQNRALR